MPLTKPKASQINFDVTNITDPLIGLNSGQTGSNDKDAGIVIERGDNNNVAIIWDESTDRFSVINTTETGTTSGNVSISSYADIIADEVLADKLTLTGAHSSDSASFFAESSSTLTTFVAQITDDHGAGNQDKFVVRHNSYTGSGLSPQALDMATFKRATSSPHKAEIDLNGAVTINEVYTLPSADGTNGQALVTDGSGNISFATVSGAFTAESDGASLTDTTNDSNAGPVITLTRDKNGTVYDGDYLGQIKFKGDNDVGQSTVYAKMTAKVLDASDGTEDGIIEYAVRKAGSNTVVARLRSDSFQLLNGTSLSVNGSVDATSYTGDGSGLSGIATNSISQGDSTLAVTDTGTGSATLTLDNATHTTFNSSGITLASGVFSGTATSAQYADLAEIYASDEIYEPGTVLIFGGDKEVTTTKIMADHRVAGVVSTNPAHLMNSDADGVAVALRGRVPCKIDGPVRKGDIIVSGPIPGTGVALAQESALPNAICVVGKAIEENLNTGIKIAEIVV